MLKRNQMLIFVIGYAGTPKNLVILDYYKDTMYIREKENIIKDLEKGIKYSNIELENGDIKYKTGKIEDYGDFMGSNKEDRPYILTQIKDDLDKEIGYEIITVSGDRKEYTEEELITNYKQFANAKVENQELHLDTTIPIKKVYGAYNKGENLQNYSLNKEVDILTENAYKPIKYREPIPEISTQVGGQGVANNVFEYQMTILKQTNTINELTQEINKLQDQITKLDKEKEFIRKQYQEEMDKINQTIEFQQAEKERINTEKENLENIKQEYQKEADEKQEEINKLNEQIKTIEEEKAQLEKLSEEANQAVTSLENTIEEMGVKYNKLDQEHQTLNQEKENLVEKLTEIDTLKIEKASLEEQITNIKADFEAQEQALINKYKEEAEEVLKARNKALEEKMTEKDTELTIVKQEKEELEEKLNTQTEELNKQKEENTESKEYIETLEEKIIEQVEKIDLLTTQLETKALNEEKAQTKENDKLKTEIEELNKKIKDLNQEIENYKNEKQSREAEFDNIEDLLLGTLQEQTEEISEKLAETKQPTKVIKEKVVEKVVEKPAKEKVVKEPVKEKTTENPKTQKVTKSQTTTTSKKKTTPKKKITLNTKPKIQIKKK